LTATIKRYFDEEGTKIVTDYFHDVVYRYTMSEAIRDGYLCEYVYHIRQVDLTDDEYVDYRDESLTMARYYSQIKKNPDALEKFQRAAERRANIVKSADNKLNELSKIIQEGRKLNYGLVYCNFDQIRKAQNILTDNKPRPIHSRQVTQRNTPLRKQKEEIFQGLVDGLYDVILAINILDEGWDCPEVRRCILMASSGNEKQFVQRRGRILRPFDKTYPDGTTKEFAEIYDMCVLPNILDDADDQVRNMEMGLIKAQLNRMQIMADSAKNEADCYEIINNFKVKFGLSAASEK
jgi:superfamily II DNA or RNA helicase